MGNKGASSGQQRGRFALAVAGLGLVTAITLSLSEPLLTIFNKNHDKISVFLFVHGSLFFLVPLTFYINMFLLLHLVMVQAAAPEAPLSVFLNKHLPRAASVVSLANLLLTAPLLMHMSVAEESAGFAVGATSAVLALVYALTAAFKKFLISSCHAGRGFTAAFFALCISTGTRISFDPMLLFSNNNHCDFLSPLIPIHLMLSFLSFFAFLLSTTLVLICIGTSAGWSHNGIHAQKLVIAALSTAIAALLVGWYMKAYMLVTGMGSVPV